MPQFMSRSIRTRWLALGVGSAVAGVAASMARRRAPRSRLPDGVAMASLTATSVQNAAKGTVISAVRASDQPDGYLVSETVREAIREAATAGVDLVPAAVGATLGAIEIAQIIGESPLAAGQRAATAASEEARNVSETAQERVRDALAAYLEHPTS